jgi:hypothetical protein
MNLGESDLNLLRRLIELPETGRTNTGGILRGYAELKAGGYAKTSIVDGDILTEITALGRSALDAHDKLAKGSS